ncbi:MAG TPA: DUF4389 domain-containing protein, partial [Trebonia sp.]|nr:DUF4389 domain-containing protein [Trebonia sp.]
MTAFSPYQAYPGPAPVLTSEPPPILLAVADPEPQRRPTVLVRLLLAVPHLIVLYILTLVAGVVVFIGWWGALFTGRLPEFAVSYLSGFLRWWTRVYAYVWLLTDVYPPFTLDDDASYPVRVAIPPAQRLNRAAVFFRFILVIPVYLLLGIIAYGAFTLMGFAAWLITLVAGRLPAPIHFGYVAVLRLTARLYGYYWLLTPAYPGGLYGDAAGTVTWADTMPAGPAPGYGAPEPVYGAPGPAAYGTPGYNAPVTPGYGSAGTPGYGGQAYGTPGYGDQGYAGQAYGAPGTPSTPGAFGAPGTPSTPGAFGAPGTPGGFGAPSAPSAPGG